MIAEIDTANLMKLLN